MENEILMSSPIVAITLFSIVAVVASALTKKDKATTYILSITGLAVVLVCAIFTLDKYPEYMGMLTASELITRNTITFGGFAAFFDIIFAVGGLLTLISARNYLRRDGYELNEFYTLILFAVAGMIIIAHSANLLVLFIGIEIMSISFYVLAGFFRRSALSIEASLKYFLLGAFATGFLLYGIAMIYGSSASLGIDTIALKVKTGGIEPTYLATGIGLMVIGLSFKVAAFPFHQWAPDVYSGSPTIVTGFMSTTGKAAAFAAFIIVGRAILPLAVADKSVESITHTTQLILAVISAATMVIGNITALVQKNVKRMLAYSSVAHAGYLMIGIVANNPRGWSAVAYYSVAYLFMQLGAFLVVSVLEKDTDKNQELADYSGLRKRHPMIAAAMAIFMFSLAGLPPFAGFFGKYYLFTAAVDAGFLWLAIVAVIASMISMYFYIGLIVYMYFKDQPQDEPAAETKGWRFTLVISAAGVVLFGIFPSMILDLTNSFF